MINSSPRAVVLAAGQGTRMKSMLPKVLHPLAGQPLLTWVLGALAEAELTDITVVVGKGAEEVRAAVPSTARTVLQSEMGGTGRAAQVALEEIGDPVGTVLVVPGDAPLITGDTYRRLLAHHTEHGDAVTMLTAQLADPTGYGRVLRDAGGNPIAIVEEVDATPEQRRLTEVAVSVYTFDGSTLVRLLRQLEPHNQQGEHYLTDVIGMLAGERAHIETVPAAPTEVAGVNTHQELAAAARMMRARINGRLMQAGVWMLDPERVYVEAGVVVEAGARLYPDVYLEGNTAVGKGATVGPGVLARDSQIGAGARVWFSVLRGVKVGAEAEVGPYASLRPGTVLAAKAKAGTFVEMKNTTVGRGSKVPHLSYMGDTVIGEQANIGAGTITCNYDGFDKHPTTIGDGAFIGSDTMLVAPVEIGEDAFTGAGSVITKDVPPGALGISRADQRNISGYAARRRSKAKPPGQKEE